VVSQCFIHKSVHKSAHRTLKITDASAVDAMRLGSAVERATTFQSASSTSKSAVGPRSPTSTTDPSDDEAAPPWD
jgi:hypothetical protein